MGILKRIRNLRQKKEKTKLMVNEFEAWHEPVQATRQDRKKMHKYAKKLARDALKSEQAKK